MPTFSTTFNISSFVPSGSPPNQEQLTGHCASTSAFPNLNILTVSRGSATGGQIDKEAAMASVTLKDSEFNALVTGLGFVPGMQLPLVLTYLDLAPNSKVNNVTLKSTAVGTPFTPPVTMHAAVTASTAANSVFPSASTGSTPPNSGVQQGPGAAEQVALGEPKDKSAGGVS